MRLSSPVLNHQTRASPMLIVQLTLYILMRKVQHGVLSHPVRFFQQCFPVVAPLWEANLRWVCRSCSDCFCRCSAELCGAASEKKKGKALLRSRRPLLEPFTAHLWIEKVDNTWSTTLPNCSNHVEPVVRGQCCTFYSSRLSYCCLYKSTGAIHDTTVCFIFYFLLL